MDLRFIEAGGNELNWGKFAVGLFTAEEWLAPEQYPGAHGLLIHGRGWSAQHIWVLDLQTGEGAMFLPGGLAAADLDKHRIWVCPMFEPFLAWLYEYIGGRGASWWVDLPPVVMLPNAPRALSGYRRKGGQDG